MIISWIIGSLIEQNDKKKEEERQQRITASARNNMRNHHYIQQFSECCGWTRVKLEDYRFAYVDIEGHYLNNELFVSCEDFENDLAPVRIYDKGVSLVNSSGKYLIPFEEGKLVATHIKKIFPGVYAYKKVVYSKPSYVDHEEIYIYNSSGKRINDNYYSEVLEVRDNYLKVRRNNSVSEIDFNGNVIDKLDLGSGFFKVRIDGKPFRSRWSTTTTNQHTNSWSPIHTDTPKSTEYYLFFDTETSGLPKDYKAPSSNTQNWPRLVQLSWILTDSSRKHIRVADYIIKPDGFTIPDDASRLHGITTQRALNEGDDLKIVITAFLMDLKKATAIVGHNIDFDKKVVGAELIRLGEKDLISSFPSFCTMKSGTNYCAIPGNYGYKYPTLQELHKKLFGIGFANEHNSASDISATEKCFWEMIDKGIIKV